MLDITKPMNRLAKTLQQNKGLGKGVFMAGIVPGFPDLDTSHEIAKAVIEAGADILELSASFSDPVADGPTLQQAHQQVLRQGINKADAFGLYKKIRQNFPETPLFVIEYANCVYHPGLDNYYRKLAESGVDALLIPDLSLEESAPFVEAAKNRNISQVFIVAPTTPQERLQRITQATSAFLYLVTITGVTGQRDMFLQETAELIQKVKQTTNTPVIVGFGISRPEHIKQALSAGADGVVTCSAVINLINQYQTDKSIMMQQLKEYIKGMKQATLLA